jgi:hypothetical protein
VQIIYKGLGINCILPEQINICPYVEYQAQMVRRVKAYLNNMRVMTDEDKLHSLSLECEPSGSAPNSVPVRKRHPSPTLSTTSSTSSTSEGKKGIAGTKFGEFQSFSCASRSFTVKPQLFTFKIFYPKYMQDQQFIIMMNSRIGHNFSSLIT